MVLFALVLAGCTSVPEIRFAQAGEPTLRSGSVVFAGVDGELYATVGSDAIVQLTNGDRNGDSGAVKTAYAWAGSSVVYATQERDPSGGISGAVYRVSPGKAPRMLLRRAGFAPFFLYPSPDSSRIGYLGSESDSVGLVMGSITVDGHDDIIHGRGQPFYAAWSPDSSTLLTHVGLPFSPTGSMLELQSVEAMLHGSIPGPLGLSTAGFQAPAFSPDGRLIAVALRRENTNVVAVVRTETVDAQYIALLSGSAALGWSPDGERLAFVDGAASRTGGIVGKLWVANTAGAEIRLVSERATAFFWSPDSSKVLFLEPYVVGGGRGAFLLYRVGIYRTFDGESDVIAVIRPTDAFVGQVIPFFDQYLRAYTIWSPDSRLVVLNSLAEDGTPVIHLVDTEKQRSGEQFNVAYRMPVQSAAEMGLITEEGVLSRILGFGTLPFFSIERGVDSLEVPPEGSTSGERVSPEHVG